MGRLDGAPAKQVQAALHTTQLDGQEPGLRKAAPESHFLQIKVVEGPIPLS